MRIIFSVLLTFFYCHVLAQVYTIDTSIPVSDSSGNLLNPWTGGLNAGQYSTMDVDNDGVDDLVIFDRTSAKLNVFLSKNGEYVYDPLAEKKFPEGMTDWVLLRDFNCDGKKDIFTSDPFGIKVYVNTSVEEQLSWRVFNSREPQSSHLLTKGFSDNPINLQMNASDIPAIDDIDSDGDLDILVFSFPSSSTVEFHKNLSIENSASCDSLQFERVTQAWGDFEECNCGLFAFDDDECFPSGGGRVEHQSGKSLVTLDIDGDGDVEALVGEEDCSFLSLLNNSGNSELADFDSFNSLFPSSTRPVNLNQFPAGYLEDIDNDGIKDLIVAPNIPFNIFSVDFKKSSWFYKNVGTNSSPDYEFIQQDFLQSSMLDFGENAAPAFYDYDSDGDLDMFVGAFMTDIPQFRSTIQLYENIGTSNQPFFQLLNDDLYGFSLSLLINFKPKFSDIDGDGLDDLLFTATSLQGGGTNLYYLKRIPGNFAFETDIKFAFGPLAREENVSVYDIDVDGKNDLLIGRSTGRLEYLRNTTNDDGILNFSLEDETFYDLDFSPFRQNVSVAVDDLDGDGNSDMIISDARGSVSLFSNFLDNLEAPLEGVTDLVRVDESTITDIKMGSKLIPVVANLFNENQSAIVFGTGQGGMTVWRSESAIGRPGGKTVGLYPNPVRISESLTVVSTRTTRASVVNLLGQTVLKDIDLIADEEIAINISSLMEGLYILVPQHDTNSSVRFVVSR